MKEIEELINWITKYKSAFNERHYSIVDGYLVINGDYDLDLSNNQIPKDRFKYLNSINGLKKCLTDYTSSLDELNKLCLRNSRRDKIKLILS